MHHHTKPENSRCPPTTKSPTIDHRYEFVYFFDVQDGNPNGDPDAGNAPRIDPETGQGLVTDVCLKRKVRNFVQITQTEGAGEDLKPKTGYEIYVKERGILAHQQRRAYKREGHELEPDSKPATVKHARAWMCENFFDVRAFGAVMSTGKAGDEDGEDKPKKGKDQDEKKKAAGTQKLWNCGQVRGPIQLSFARSIDPILTLEHAITRVALTNPGDTKRGADVGEEATEATSGQIGRKSTVPYALYRAHGFVSPFLARDTGFSTADLDLLLEGADQHVRVRPLGLAGRDVRPRAHRLRARIGPRQPSVAPALRPGHVQETQTRQGSAALLRRLRGRDRLHADRRRPGHPHDLTPRRLGAVRAQRTSVAAPDRSCQQGGYRWKSTTCCRSRACST